MSGDPDAWAARSLARGPHDRRRPDDFAAALDRETDASLRKDPSRWPWQRSDEVPDSRKTRHQEAS